MPRTKSFTHSEVLEKAVEVFWAKGYNGTSMQDIVDHLGLSRSSIYDTFGDKHGLFVKAFEHYREQNARHLDEFLSTRPNVVDGIRELLKSSVQRSCNAVQCKGCFIVNTTAELASDDTEMHQMLKKNQSHFELIFLSHLERAERAGQISAGKNLPVIASMIFTYYSGLNVVGIINTEPEQMFSGIDLLLSMLDTA